MVAAVVVLPGLDRSEDRRALWSALTPLLVILVQAGAYWLWARSWVDRAPVPTAAGTAYRTFRRLDAALLAAGLGGILIWWPSHLAVATLVMAVWVLGLVEYVNYFVVRLAYPWSRWLTSVGQRRTPRLLQDIEESEGRRLLRAGTTRGRRRPRSR